MAGATITRGYTFSSTELVTNTKLHALVDSATLSGFDETNLASGKGLVVRSTSAPVSTSSVWVDTNFSPPIAKVYDGVAWSPIAWYKVLTNKSGAGVTAGLVVLPDTTTDSSFKTGTTADVPCLGVVMETIANNADGVIALPGAWIGALVTSATVTRGQLVGHSTTLGKVTPAGVNACAIALSATSGAGTLTSAIVIPPVFAPTTGGTSGQVPISQGAGAQPVFGARLNAKVITATRDMTAASGSVAYTGVGFTPKIIMAFGCQTSGLNVSEIHWGMCSSSSANFGMSTQNTGDGVGSTAKFIYIQESAGLDQSAVLASFDVDGFTLTWTKTGTPTGTNTFGLLCLG